MNPQFPVETKFSRFLRHGGSREIILRLYPRPLERFEQKSDINSEVISQKYQVLLEAEADRIRTQIVEAFVTYSPDTNLEIELDPSAQIEKWMEQFRVSLLGDPTQVNKIEAWVMRFGAELNAKWQSELGVRLYIWRSKDDDKVRSSHAQYDDQIFSWAEPPEGGHPGQDFNCRCWAEPVILNQYGGNRYLAAQELFEELFKSEGFVPHMYLDTNRKVTIGKGKHLINVDIALHIPFVDKSTGELATEAQIHTDYQNVKNIYQPGITSSGLAVDNNLWWTSYSDITQLRIDEDVADKLAIDHILMESVTAAISKFREINSFPLPAQVAILDLIYNIGSGNFNDSKWPSFFRAVKRRDWQRAALESRRYELSDERNNWVKNLLLEAYEIEESR